MERCGTTNVAEATKATTKASPYSPVNPPQRCIHFSTQGAVRGSITYTQCCGHSTTWRLPTTPRGKIATSTTKTLHKRNSHNRKLPHKDPHQGDLGLQGFTRETAPKPNSFGRQVDQHLLYGIPEGIANLMSREGDLRSSSSASMEERKDRSRYELLCQLTLLDEGVSFI